MRTVKLILLVALASLIAAACSSDSDNGTSAPQTSAPTTAATATPDPTQESVAAPNLQADLADALYQAISASTTGQPFFSNDAIRCIAEGFAGVFSDERLEELGFTGESVTVTYQSSGPFGLAVVYDISDGETSEMVDKASTCLDWRGYIAEIASAQGMTPDQAACIASELSDETVHSVISNALIEPSGIHQLPDDDEMQEAVLACDSIRAMLVQSYVAQGISQDGASCYVAGLPDAFIQIMTGQAQPPEDPAEAQELFGDLAALESECLTPEEVAMVTGG